MIDEANGNMLGMLWKDSTMETPTGEQHIKADPTGYDDIIQTTAMYLIKDQPVKLIINSRDVIHDVGLPHFRMKMDAVPGTPTTMWFTPKFTTREMKQKYGDDFEYEISCDQMCGKGHYSMRGTIVVESEAEFRVWLAKQTPQYVTATGGAAAPAATPATTDSTATGGNAIKTSH